MVELKGCPFCGAAAAPCTTDKGVIFAIACGQEQDCPVAPLTDNFETPDEAIAAWNTRPPADEALRIAVEACKHYDEALLAAFPNGAGGEVFVLWNDARIARAKIKELGK